MLLELHSQLHNGRGLCGASDLVVGYTPVTPAPNGSQRVSYGTLRACSHAALACPLVEKTPTCGGAPHGGRPPGRQPAVAGCTRAGGWGQMVLEGALRAGREATLTLKRNLQQQPGQKHELAWSNWSESWQRTADKQQGEQRWQAGLAGQLAVLQALEPYEGFPLDLSGGGTCTSRFKALSMTGQPFQWALPGWLAAPAQARGSAAKMPQAARQEWGKAWAQIPR